MSSAAKALVYGMLTFFEIVIVVFFVMALAAIAAFASLGARKRNRAREDGKLLCWTSSVTGHLAD